MENILGNDEKYQEIIKLLEGFVNTCKNLLKSTDNLSLANKMLPGNLEKSVNHFLRGMDSIIDNYSRSNKILGARMEELQKSIDNLAKKVGQ